MKRPSPIRPSLVGKLNEREILHVLQSHGAMSRADLTRSIGLSAPTISKAVSSLLRAGLIEEISAVEPIRGRPATRLQLASQAVQILGVVVDVEYCEVVSAGLDGVLHADAERFPTPELYEQLLDRVTEHCQPLMQKPGVATLGVGVSLPGLIDDRRGFGVLSPNLRMTNHQCPARDLGERLGVVGQLIQESHGLCLAERHYGYAVGLDDFAILDIGAGVGLGVMSGGRLVTGHQGFAGEIGHITAVFEGGLRCGCGNTGCLETVCNDAAFARRVSQRLRRPVSVSEALELAATGRGPIAQELYQTASYLAVAVAAVVNLFNPSHLFLHSRLLSADPSLLKRVLELARQRSLPPAMTRCHIALAKGTKQQGAVAAIVGHLTNAVVAED